MPEYYYTSAPTSEHEERSFRAVFAGRVLAFDTDAGVFSKQHVDPAPSSMPLAKNSSAASTFSPMKRSSVQEIMLPVASTMPRINGILFLISSRIL